MGLLPMQPFTIKVMLEALHLAAQNLIQEILITLEQETLLPKTAQALLAGRKDVAL